MMARKDEKNQDSGVVHRNTPEEADAIIKEANREAGFKVGDEAPVEEEERPQPTSFENITVNRVVPLRNTVFTPNRLWRVSTETADELGDAVATREEALP
jgi:hypothetical protein